MSARLLERLEAPVERQAKRLSERFPLLSMVLMQAAVSVAMISVVSGIVLCGGALIWLFYRAVGVM